MDELMTEKPRARDGWYWMDCEEGPCTGPFETRAVAAQDFWESGSGEDQYLDMLQDIGDDPKPTKDEFLADYEFIHHMGSGPISTDVFDADAILECFEEKNEDMVWDEAPPEWPKDAARDLEKMLADALYRWSEKHHVWKQFRALS